MLKIGLTGPRGVGKSVCARILQEQFGFTVGHAFGPGKAMCVTYYEYLGIDSDTAYRMVYTDLKDTPCDRLPGGVASRYFMEHFGYWMGTHEKLGTAWTLGGEVKHWEQDGDVRGLLMESVVYEADDFRAMGGIIIRINRDVPEDNRILGDKTDEAQAKIIADYDIDNNGTIEETTAHLFELVELLGGPTSIEKFSANVIVTEHDHSVRHIRSQEEFVTAYSGHTYIPVIDPTEYKRVKLKIDSSYGLELGPSDYKSNSEEQEQ